MPTMATFMQLLPAASRAPPTEQTDGTVYQRCRRRGVAPGSASRSLRVRAARRLRRAVMALAPLDADVESVLFSFSDRPVQEALGLLREERAPAGA